MKYQARRLPVAGAPGEPVCPQCVRFRSSGSSPPLTSGGGGHQSSGLGWQLRKGASQEGRGRSSLAWGAFSQELSLVGRLLQVIPTSNKKGFSDTKEGSTWPVPGRAWHLNSEIRVVQARRQTGPSRFPFAEMPGTCGHSSSPGLAPIVDPADKLIRLK